MEMVPPGDVTGYYYIIVAGLPWNCSWQKLKDICKDQQPDGTCLEVDHVHVSTEGSRTNGWVRVQGKENFRKMMDHLGTVVIDGYKCLVVDGRNETVVTSINFAVCPRFGSLPYRTRNGSSSSADTYASSTTSYYGRQNNSSTSLYTGSEGWYDQHQAGLPSSPMSATSPTGSFYQQPSPIYQNVNLISTYKPAAYSQSAPGVVYASNIAPTTPVYVNPIPLSPIYPYQAPIRYPETSLSTSTSAPLLQPEARKVVITQLPHGTSHRQLEQLLHKYIARAISKSSTNSPQDELHELNIVTHADRRHRGHAFAVLESEHIARYVVKSLDGYRFQGRELRARFAKEGVESAAQYSTSTEPHLMSPLPDNQYKAFEPNITSPKPRDGDSTAEHAPQPAVKALAREDSKAKRESKEKLRDRERKDSKKKTASPLVVNGSSSERESKSKKRRSW